MIRNKFNCSHIWKVGRNQSFRTLLADLPEDSGYHPFELIIVKLQVYGLCEAAMKLYSITGSKEQK